MGIPIDRLFSARRLWLLLAAACFALVLASLVLTGVLRLHPCYLCVFQRLLFLLMAIFALMAALSRVSAVAVMAGVLFLSCATTGGGVASYQVWLQAQPGAEFMCTAGAPNPIETTVEWLNRQVPLLFRATGNCASKELVILKLSLAGWSLAAFAASLPVGILALWQARTRRPGHDG